MGYFRAASRVRVLAAASSVIVITAIVSAGLGPVAQAEAVTCQGLAATVVGPTVGQNTTGTEGDDVIVAPLYPKSLVQGLGGNDTICLVNGLGGSNRDPMLVLAGTGNDSVVNEATVATSTRVELGTGADSFVGADYGEQVYTADQHALKTVNDSEIDNIDTGGGNDQIASGTSGFPNHDVISTGAGRDLIRYGGLAGGAIDNGKGRDGLLVVDEQFGGLTVDNVERKAKIGASTVLSWTAIRGFGIRASPGSYFRFTGSDADESVDISGTAPDLAVPSAITTGGGDDRVHLENYLPTSLDMGKGYDSLGFQACYRAYVALAVSAECLTSDDQQVSTALAGIEGFWGSTGNGLTVQGSDQADYISASARFVLVRGGPGDDRVRVRGLKATQVVGGRGDDRLNGVSPNGVILNGGRGGDVLRGGIGADSLYGGRGTDTAYGKAGKDLCRTEVRVGCELR